MNINYHDESTLMNLLPSAIYATTTTGSAVDVREFYGKCKFILNVSAGGTGTLDVKLTDCATAGGSYADIVGATFTQVTTGASLQSIGVNVDACQGFIKAVATIGTGPTTFSLVGVGSKIQF